MSTTTSPPPTTNPAAASFVFTSYQKFVVAVLAFLQFTVILDFMILSPLGAMLMRDLKIPASRFGFVMSVYAFSAGVSGLIAAGYADRFDRKRMLLFFYAGFVLGTLFCGLAPTYELLLAARMFTGLFGGVIASIVFAITADLFPLSARGRVMGVVQTAFAVSQVMGIPLGLLLSNRWGWHAPFLFIVAVATLVGIVIALKLKPINAHLTLARHGRNAFQHLFATVSRREYLRAYSATMLLVTGGFLMMPFASAFSVNNLGLDMNKDLWKVYMVTGAFSIVAGPIIGRLSDSVGKYPVFCVGSVVSMTMVVVFTHLGRTPLAWVIVVNTVLMLGISTRMISASALTSAVPDMQDRGAFMSLNSAIQQVTGGISAAAAGLIVTQGADGRLLRYDLLGYVVVVAMIVAMSLLYGINRAVAAKFAAAAARSATPPGGAPASGGGLAAR